MAITYSRKRSFWRNWSTPILALVILVPAMLGFGNKFLEFLKLTGDEEGSFALMPVLNYLLTSAGFLLLFGWAIMNGMFRDMEKPKYTMLETQRDLDEEVDEVQRREEYNGIF
jgi:hypothetical protein